MNRSQLEIAVGVFVLIGVASLGYLAVRLGKMDILGNSGYVVYGDFASVAGLKVGDPVEIAGVKVGSVESVRLAEHRARLGLKIENGVKLQDDVIASVRARGIIGDKFVLLIPGGSDRELKEGDRIRETESPPDLQDLVGKFVGGDLTSGGKEP